MNDDVRYSSSALTDFVIRLFQAAGCDADKPHRIARHLVEADLLGHTTHGLQLAGPYLDALHNGTMLATGEALVISDRGPTIVWDGRRLSGVWLTSKAIDLAIERAVQYGTCTVAIRQAHHIACLATFLQAATDRGLMIILASSDPAAASVTPFGGRRAVYTPDPLAVGIPTDGDPILIDISASITTNGMANRLHREGQRFPGMWALDSDGVPTDDPGTLHARPPGSLLPVGGLDHGHKGYGLALMIESLTQGLGGFGRADGPTQWGASVFVQVLDPTAFGGADQFVRQTAWLANACRTTPPMPGLDAVRLPGQRGLDRKRAAIKDGVSLYPGIIATLQAHARRLGVDGLTTTQS